MGFFPNIEWEKRKRRALIALDVNGIATVLATDCVDIKCATEDVSAGAEDIGLVDSRDLQPGLHLWEGTAKMEHESYESFGPPTELNFYGDTRPVEPHEQAELFAMKPPEPEGGES
jgi:hypothetical protein